MVTKRNVVTFEYRKKSYLHFSFVTICKALNESPAVFHKHVKVGCSRNALNKYGNNNKNITTYKLLYDDDHVLIAKSMEELIENFENFKKCKDMETKALRINMNKNNGK